ncbi:MAG: N-acetyltransferase [Neomegalonema sp.]|nr:N-acetyltransferase [Neomegalonema sp.]
MLAFASGDQGREADIIALFTETFTASEGREEGAVIGSLARNLLATTPAPDLHVFWASDAEASGAAKILGCVIASRLTYAQDTRSVFVLGPVAVTPHRQQQGIGQALLSYGLDRLRQAQIDIVLTYGDPDYYRQVGFEPIPQTEAAAPYKLQYPHGWLGQSLTGHEWNALKGRPVCVPALNAPVFW